MTKRLVMYGYKRPERATRTDHIDNYPKANAEAAGLIPWNDKPDPSFRKPDADEIRKQRIEDRLAGGEEDRA